MEQVNVALLGLGTVGTGVWKMLSTQRDSIAKKTGKSFEVKGILIRNTQKERNLPGTETLLTDRFEDLFQQRIDVVIEAMGGTEPALTYIKEAITRGCHIVTANKELVARHGGELHRLAKKHDVQFLFEASVGGGIPALGTLQHFLKVNQIHQIMGIVNGTTNYILTKMEEEKRDFADVLQEAQAKGYAEANPSADVDGLDSVYKLAILIRVVFGMDVSVDDIYVEGITDVTLPELELAQSLGYRIKLISQAKQFGEEGPVTASVRPMLLPLSHPLSQIQDVYNAIYVESDQVQDVTLVGQGAGEKPTASAVVEDVTNIYRLPSLHHIYPTKPLLSAEELASEQFVQFTVHENIGREDQKEIIALFNRTIGKVKHWTYQSQNQTCLFALVVEKLHSSWEERLQQQWKRKIHEAKVRPVLAYGTSNEDQPSLEAAHCSK